MTPKTTKTKILKALMSKQPKAPKELAIEIDRDPATVRNTLVFMVQESLVRRIDYGQYTITELGKEEFNRLMQSPTIQSSRGRE